MTAALLSDVELSVLTVVIARGELLTNGDAQRLRGHVEALGEKYAAAVALESRRIASAIEARASRAYSNAGRDWLLEAARIAREATG